VPITGRRRFPTKFACGPRVKQRLVTTYVRFPSHRISDEQPHDRTRRRSRSMLCKLISFAYHR
jgi:hypothetical protein